MHQELRVLFLKQAHDIFGPWEGFDYNKTDPLSILERFKYKPTFWEQTCALKADWRIVPTCLENYFYKLVMDKEHSRKAVETHQKDIMPLGHVRFQNYDTVITFEPFLPEQVLMAHPNIRFFYIHHEHKGKESLESLDHPAAGYTAYLDHMLRGEEWNPVFKGHILGIPYMRVPEVVRTFFPRSHGQGKPKVRIEPRTLIKAVKKNSHNLWNEACGAYLDVLRGRYPEVELSTREMLHQRSYNTPDDGQSDALAYYKALAEHDFYISIVAAGAGQALVDAASAGAVCIGTSQLPYHRMICSPGFLFDDLEQAISAVIGLSRNPERIEAIRQHQDRMLQRHMFETPVRTLIETPSVPKSPALPIESKATGGVVEYGFPRKL